MPVSVAFVIQDEGPAVHGGRRFALRCRCGETTRWVGPDLDSVRRELVQLHRIASPDCRHVVAIPI